jgi:RNA recognition motif-containing protein
VVQGIPWKFTWQDLKDHFAEIGGVERADIMQAPDGRSKVRARAREFACNGGPHRGLPSSLTRVPADARRYGPRKTCRIARAVPAAWRPTTPPLPACLPTQTAQGWGTVRFTTTDAAQAAIDRFHGSDLEGRTLTVFLDKKA